MRLVFDRRAQLLHILVGAGALSFRAANIVASASRGPWPDGVFDPDRLIRVTGQDGDRDGAYGSWFLRFKVAERTGMGIHAGRENAPDGMGRIGFQHATMGCIRTSWLAMEELARLCEQEGLPRLWVE